MKATIILAKNPEKEEDKEELRKRIIKGVEIFNKNSCDFIILSGGLDVEKNKKEAELMEEIMLSISCVKAEKIIKELKSKDTVENAYFCKRVIKEKRIEKIYIVSSDYHMKRVKMAFESLIPDVKKVYVKVKTGKTESKELIKKTEEKIRKLIGTKAKAFN